MSINKGKIATPKSIYTNLVGNFFIYSLSLLVQSTKEEFQ